MTKISQENLFEIDECMKELIILLNKKGLETTCCCSGHEKGQEFHTISSQENFLNHKYQYGMTSKQFFNRKMNGLIIFKRKKDRDFVLSELKKTKYGNRFIGYLPFNGKKYAENDYITFKIRGLSQNEIERFWRKLEILIN
jgi:hypothetical protein